jgi:transcriptional regulator with XRE-family HTH domain
MKETVIKSIVAGAIIAVSFSSCNNSGKEEAMSAADSAALMESKQKAQKVFFAIPSPLEMANMIKQSGASFNKSILNPTSNASKYSNTVSQAVNLGIYSADLSYCSSFDQTQDAMQYMSTSKKLADALGVTGALSENTLARLEKNVNNKDSLLDLVSESYAATDAFLRENDRASTTALIVAGGWIEAIYISSKLASTAKANSPIVTRIGEQKDILKNLINLVESYPGDKNLEGVLADLKAIYEIYESGVDVKTESGIIKTDESAKKTVIEDTSEITMSPEKLVEITKKIADVRNNYVK